LLVQRAATSLVLGRLRLGTWEVVALAGVVALAAALRLVGIANDTDISDEGIRVVQLRLMQAGYWPVREIYASQGPLSLPASYPLFALLGADVVAARLAVVAYSLAGLLATFWIGRRVAGAAAGLGACLLLALSPVYLDNSRLALVEVISIAPALASLVTLLRYRDGGRRRWLVATGVLLACALLVKPMVVMAVAATAVLLATPILSHTSPRDDAGPSHGGGLTTWASWRTVFADVVLCGGVGLAVIAATILAIGPAEVYTQLVDYRIGARAVADWDLAENVALVRGEFAREGVGLPLAAAVGALILARRRPMEAGALLLWLVAGVAVLLLYSPLRAKHVVYLIPPLALFGGVAFGAAWELMQRGRRRSGAVINKSVIPKRSEGSHASESPAGQREIPRRTLLRMTDPATGSGQTVVVRRRWAVDIAGAAGVLAVGAYLLGVPTVAAENRRLLTRAAMDDHVRYADDLRVVVAATGPGDFVVMDDAYLAGMTGRLMPPYMADLSYTRILARTLPSQRAKEETENFGVRVAVVQDDHLGQQPRYLDWLDRNYVLVKSYVRRAPNRFRRVYVHPNVDLAPVRAALADSIEHPWRAEAGPVAMLGYTLDREYVAPSDVVWITTHLEALMDQPTRHDAVFRLRARDGAPVQEMRRQIGDGDQRIATWLAGQWQIQTHQIEVDRRMRPGSYSLTLAFEPPGGPATPITPVAGSVPTTADDEIVLGTLRVR